MKYLSVCSGIEAASCAWHWLGWEAAGFSEIDAFPSAVLAERFPSVENFGDFTAVTRSPETLARLGSVDLLVGGTPCQSFSVAGLRKGLEDERGNLALEFMRLAAALRPRWILWENVPGVLSSSGGRDFGAILGALAELGYGFAWRVLDARYFGVPQRRRRVFLVGHSGGSSESPATVLFEPESLRGNPLPQRKARKEAAPGAGSRADRYSLTARGSHAVGAPPESRSLVTSQGKHDPTMLTYITQTALGFHPTQNPISSVETSPRLSRGVDGMGVCVTGSVTHALTATGFDASEDGTGRGTPIVSAQQSTSSVRRLTPLECERLQGFPDGWTAISYKGKPAADGPRYKAIGNSMAVPVMFWLGRRIAMVDAQGPWRGSA